MIYLHGLDGTGFSASSQFATLSKEFDLVCLNIPSNDRSDVFEIVDIVATFIERAKEEHPEREVQLIGESMGGAMSLFVCLKHPELVTRATVVNPASSFDRSVWPSVGPLLPQIPENLYAGLPFALSPGTHRSHSISDGSRGTWKFERNFRKDDGDVTGVGIVGDHYSQRYVETPFANISGRVCTSTKMTAKS